MNTEQHEDIVVDSPSEYEISASIRANCVESLVKTICLFEPNGALSAFSANSLVLEANVHVESPDNHVMDVPEWRLIYHWSEANHESLGLGDNDVEMWLDLDWTERVLRIPGALISRLMLTSAPSTSPLTLKFRVWVRMIEANTEDSTSLSGRALASSLASIDVILGTNPLMGSCEFTPNNVPLPNPLIALETPVRVRCHGWIDPMLDIITPQQSDSYSATNLTYRTSLQLRRAESSLCNTTANSGASMSRLFFDEYEAVVVPQHRLMSAEEAEAVLPYGCWTVMAAVRSEHSGLTALTVVAEALQVDLPQRVGLAFTSNSDAEAYYHFVMERRLSFTTSSTPSITDVAVVVRDILDETYNNLETDASDAQIRDMDAIVGLIRKVSDVVEREGPSRDVAENQQLFRVISAAIHIAVVHQHRRQDDAEHSESSAASDDPLLAAAITLSRQTLGDRQHHIDAASHENDITLHREQDVPLLQQILNLRMIFHLLDQWVMMSDNPAKSCQRKSESLAHLSSAVKAFKEAAWLLQGDAADTIMIASRLSFFQDIQVMNSLESAMDFSNYHLSRINADYERRAAWLAGGQVQSSKLKFVTVSIKRHEFPLCSMNDVPNQHPIESSVVLSVVMMDDAKPAAAGGALVNEPANILINRVTIMMKASNFSEDLNEHSSSSTSAAETAARESQHRLSKCAWFDDSLSRWTPSGCATFDTRRPSPHRQTMSVGDNEMPLILCECTHLTEFAVLLYRTSSASLSRSGATKESRAANLYNTSQQQYMELQLHLYACLALMIVALGNSIYSVKTVFKAQGLLREQSMVVQNITIFSTLLMSAVVVYTLHTLAQIFYGYELHAILIIDGHYWSQLGLLVSPILISLRFSLYSFFTILVMAPLRSHKQFGHVYVKGMSKNHKKIIIVFSGVMAVVAVLIVSDQSLKIVSLLVGISSMVVAIRYTSIAYRCFVLLKHVSKATSGRIQAKKISYNGVARFTLSMSVMYGIGFVCQSVMYLSSVYLSQLYAENFHLFQVLFKWSDMFTLMASMIYIYRSLQTIKRHHDAVEKQNHTADRHHHHHQHSSAVPSMQQQQQLQQQHGFYISSARNIPSVAQHHHHQPPQSLSSLSTPPLASLSSLNDNRYGFEY